MERGSKSDICFVQCACIGAYESVQHSLPFTIVSSSNLSSQGVVFASSRMGHGCHQQLPRR